MANYEHALKKLITLLEKMTSMVNHPYEDDGPQINDPEYYPASTKITDDDAIEMIWQVEAKHKAARSKHAEYDLAMSESKTMQKRLWLKLSHLYPDVGDPLDCSVGHRKYKGSYYYVRLRDEHVDETTDEESGPGSTT